MFTLQELFDDLAYGEFSQLAIAKGHQGEIDYFNYPNVLSHINLGLSAIKVRFNLENRTTVLRLNDVDSRYYLRSSYIIGKGNGVDEYVEDDLGTGVMQIKSAQLMLKTGGLVDITLNDLTVPSVIITTPEPDVLHVPRETRKYLRAHWDAGVPMRLLIWYKALPQQLKLTPGYFNPDEITIDLPVVYKQALLYFIASRAYNPVGFEGTMHTGNNYAIKYEQECQRLEISGVDVNTVSRGDGVLFGGFV